MEFLRRLLWFGLFNAVRAAVSASLAFATGATYVGGAVAIADGAGEFGGWLVQRGLPDGAVMLALILALAGAVPLFLAVTMEFGWPRLHAVWRARSKRDLAVALVHPQELLTRAKEASDRKND